MAKTRRLRGPIRSLNDFAGIKKGGLPVVVAWEMNVGECETWRHKAGQPIQFVSRREFWIKTGWLLVGTFDHPAGFQPGIRVKGSHRLVANQKKIQAWLNKK